MKLLLDQGIFYSVTALLRSQGSDVVHTSEIGLARAEDTAILEYARREGRSIVTHDSDFHLLLATSAATGPSVIRVREELAAKPLAQLISQIVIAHAAALASGAVVSATTKRVRLRRLPIGGE